ncbi:MAG: hypothetical protein AAFV53_31815 [Myxococcota bacterium]
MAQSKGEWDRYHDLMYLFMAMGVADGPMNVVEREALFATMRQWKPDLRWRDYLDRVEVVSRRLGKPDDGVAMLKTVEKCAHKMGQRLAAKPKRAVRLLEHLRDIAQIDGGLHRMEGILLSTIYTHLNLSKVVSLRIRRRLAVIEPVHAA